MASSEFSFEEVKEAIQSAKNHEERQHVFQKIEKEFKNLKETKDKITFLKQFIKDDTFKTLKHQFIALLSLEIKKTDVAKYEIIYDSFGEGLEPIYYWILDFLRDTGPSGLGMDVKKGVEEFEASVTSGYFGEMGQRATLMQQKSMDYLGAINQVIKSILNLIYDLKEFEIRLSDYDKLKSKEAKTRMEGAYALKGVWMDNVDAKKGRGSINMLAQDLGFITLRDAFFIVENKDKIMDLDLNERVKRILLRKYAEYMEWLGHSEKEIRNRYQVERSYLRSQVATLKLYTNWVKPYLKAAQKLRMKEFNTPDLVNSFSTMEMKLGLYGKKEVKAEQVHETFAEVKLKTNYFYVVEVMMDFRSVPSAVTVSGQRQYVQGGRVQMFFKGYVFDQIELEAYESAELYEDLDLVDHWVGGSLKQLYEELERYMALSEDTEVKPEKEKKKPKMENPFAGVLKGFGEIVKPLKSLLPARNPQSFVEDDVRALAEKQAKDKTVLAYTIYKKTHGMLSV